MGRTGSRRRGRSHSLPGADSASLQLSQDRLNHIRLRLLGEGTGSTPFFLHVLGDDPGCVPADEIQVLSPENRSVHRVISNDSQRGSVFLLQADQPDLAIDRTVRVLPEEGLPLEIERAPVDVGQ